MFLNYGAQSNIRLNGKETNKQTECSRCLHRELDSSAKTCRTYTHYPTSRAGGMFSRSFGGEIPAAILFPSAALSASPCVHSLPIVGAEERTPLRSPPILRPQAPVTPQCAL